MVSVNISLELFGLLITLIPLVCCALEHDRRNGSKRILVAMLAVNCVVLTCDALTWMFSDNAALETPLYALNFMVYALGYVIEALFTHYILCYINEKRAATDDAAPGRVFGRVIDVLCTAAIALVVISLFNHMYFSYDGGVYVRGPFYWLSQVFPVGIILLNMLIVLRYRATLGLRDTLCLMIYGILPTLAMLIQIVFFGITLLYLATTASMLIIYVMIYVEQGKRLKEQEVELARASIAVMLSQIQPHFLYNALNTISYLCETDPKSAGEATDHFAKYLRANMDSLREQAPIPFRKELDHLDNYLFIEKLRFGERLSVKYDIAFDEFMLPPLTVQPLVENSIRYGLMRRPQGGTVSVSARRDGDSALLTIQDDGSGFDPKQAQGDERPHIGIENTRERLRAMCGGSMDINSAPGNGTTVRLRIPLAGMEESE